MKRLVMVVPILFSLSGVDIWESSVQAGAQYPLKPITYIVPVEAGAGGDFTARQFTKKMSAVLGQPIIIVNKPGAGSSIGYREVHDAKPDGYTIGLGMATLVTNKLQGILPYDYHDFSVMGIYANYNPIIVASTKTQRPFKTIEEVILFARSHPGEVKIATSGIGQSWWIATMAFQEGTGLKLNVIPQPGASGFAIAQVAGGHTDLGLLDLAAAKPQIDAGNVRFLAVYGSNRSPGYSNVPTLKDIGYDLVWDSTHVVIGPKDISMDITGKLTKAVEVAANDREFQKWLVEYYATPFYLPPEKIINYFDGQRKVCRSLMEKCGILKEK